jgi:tetratricopeptide (TPR) repeat protein
MFEPRQVQVARISAMLILSLSVAFTIGCSRDPNVRKQKYLESGKRYEANGKYKEAAIQFSNALKQDKAFAPAHYELAKTYIKMGTLAPAYGELLRTVDLDPSNLEARISLGNMLLAGGATDRAGAQAKAVLDRNPNYADAYALLAGVAEKKHDPAEALKDIQHAIAIDPTRSGYHSALGLLEAASPAQEPDAEQELRKAASLDAKSPMPHVLLAELLEKKGDLQGAEQEFRAAIGVSPKDLQAREALAALYVRSGDKTKTEQTLLQAVNDLPDNESASSVLAGYYGRTGQIDRAETVFADLNSKYSKSFGIKLTYARILFDKKEYSKSMTVATQLNKTDAGNTEVQILNALLLLNTGKVDDAFALLKKSVKDNPNNVQVQLLLARVAVVKGDTATSETSYRQAEKLNPGNLEAAGGLANIAIGRNDVGMLSEVADKTIQLHPDFATAYLWRGTAEANRKEYDKAEADFQMVQKNDPNGPTAYLELGELRVAQGHIPEGEAMFEKALDKDPNSARALGLLLEYGDLRAKQPAKAIARVQAQIVKAPGNGSFYNQLAYLQLQTRDFKDALDNSHKAMQLNPTSAGALQTYTQAEVALGDLDPAISAWQAWLSSHPSDVNALNSLASLEEAKGDQSQATDNYKKALQIDSSNPIASNNLAYLMVETGQNVDVALTLAQTARRGLPDSPQTADTLAWIYYYKGTYGAAREILETALRTNPDDASMQFHLGMTYVKMGDNADAELHLKKAVAIAPTTRLGKQASDELSKLPQ